MISSLPAVKKVVQLTHAAQIQAIQINVRREGPAVVTR